ncbi:MAG: glucosamine-6-phosphate deaminase [Planctomycetota bacterium]
MGIRTEISREKLTIEIHETAAEASSSVARKFVTQVGDAPLSVLGLATGGTPIECYQKLIELHRGGEVSFANATTFNLDEYVGLSADHPQSYRSFMRQNLFDHIDIGEGQSHIPDGMARSIESECEAYESRIRASGGIDLQLLGLGHNGHIAFNEPGSPETSRTRRIRLTDETIEKNARFFDSLDDVPTEAITMGIATILECRRIVMLVTGESKADAVSAMVRGPIDTDCPASLLRRHDHATVVLDVAAATGLQ